MCDFTEDQTAGPSLGGGRFLRSCIVVVESLACRSSGGV
uniref:Myosin, light polypeptide 6, alkali, smooth muscle and non-muscle n=1 Tax=Mus musculus TaxID=10090 RepID=A0A1W2P888_MOUSE